MRGKVILNHLEPLSRRITPAYAGKSQFGRSIQFQSKDHPRLCGEKLHITERFCNDQGSPPPMRGKVVFHMEFVQHHRITPAYAGKSLFGGM